MGEQALLNSCQTKQKQVKLLFECCVTAEKKYEKIIELGKQLTPYPTEFKTSDYLVKGCQSMMYLYAQLIDGKVHFYAYSEALISAGLVALLLSVYNDEPPEAILTCPPRFLEELGIYSNLSPGRANGLDSLLQRMKKEAVNFLIITSSIKNNRNSSHAPDEGVGM
jgi:cysteine desulfuration protein SufE